MFGIIDLGAGITHERVSSYKTNLVRLSRLKLLCSEHKNYFGYVLAGIWIDSNLEVMYALATRITFICPMRFNAFPMDIQVPVHHRLERCLIFQNLAVTEYCSLVRGLIFQNLAVTEYCTSVTCLIFPSLQQMEYFNSVTCFISVFSGNSMLWFSQMSHNIDQELI
jgi:hypothetical protein